MRRTALVIATVAALAAGARAADPAPLPPVPVAPASAAADPSASAVVRGGAMPSLAELLETVEKVTAEDAEAGDWSAPVKLAVVFTGLALVPAALVMTTSFTRIVIVLSFMRRALTTQNIPPTIAVIGLALFLTLFTMAPTFSKIGGEAIQPYLEETLSFEDAVDRGMVILKGFMIRETRQRDLELFLEMADLAPERPEDVPMHVAIPSFAISEFRTSFEMGCLLFIPFLIVDLVIAGILLSAGMMMLPPVIVSLPFKIILFVLVDGWRLLTESLVRSFY